MYNLSFIYERHINGVFTSVHTLKYALDLVWSQAFLYVTPHLTEWCITMYVLHWTDFFLHSKIIVYLKVLLLNGWQSIAWGWPVAYRCPITIDQSYTFLCLIGIIWSNRLCSLMNTHLETSHLYHFKIVVRHYFYTSFAINFES